MGAKSEYDAAYFTWLRAQEEHQDLLRYGDYLRREAERLERFAGETRELAQPLPRKVRRPVDQSTKPLLEAVGRRRTVILDELARMDDRVAAAQAFVEECAAEVEALRI
jgi:hypothetical protein